VILVDAHLLRRGRVFGLLGVRSQGRFGLKVDQASSITPCRVMTRLDVVRGFGWTPFEIALFMS